MELCGSIYSLEIFGGEIKSDDSGEHASAPIAFFFVD